VCRTGVSPMILSPHLCDYTATPILASLTGSARSSLFLSSFFFFFFVGHFFFCLRRRPMGKWPLEARYRFYRVRFASGLPAFFSLLGPAAFSVFTHPQTPLLVFRVRMAADFAPVRLVFVIDPPAIYDGQVGDLSAKHIRIIGFLFIYMRLGLSGYMCFP